jgi:AAA15 family ATPase/GTPase
MIKIKKIQLQNFRFFTDEEENNTFEIEGKNMLIYGENGSGKSSLFKAFEFLAKPTISEEEFEKNINIFNPNNRHPSKVVDSLFMRMSL